jgi:hypothetical protein
MSAEKPALRFTWHTSWEKIGKPAFLFQGPDAALKDSCGLERQRQNLKFQKWCNRGCVARLICMGMKTVCASAARVRSAALRAKLMRGEPEC